jgi:hypothetical protein
MTLVNTLLEPIRVDYREALDKYENRGSKYGALAQFMRDTNSSNSIFTEDTKSKIAGSFGNTVNIPVIDFKDVTLTNTRSCVIADDENTSQLINVTYTTYQFGFTMTPSTYSQNSIGYEADFAVKMKAALNKFQATLDTQCIAQLETDKNQFWTNIAPDYYAVLADALQVPVAEKEDFYNQLQSIHGTMDFSADDIQVISNWNEMANVRRYFAQGAQNGINEAFQLGPYQWDSTNRITNSVDVGSTLYSYPQGSVALYNRNDPDSIAGHTIGSADSPSKQWAVVPVVLENGMTINMGSYYTQDCEDRSALGGGANGASLIEGFSFHTDIVTMTSYNSDRAGSYSPIVKSEILSV